MEAIGYLEGGNTHDFDDIPAVITHYVEQLIEAFPTTDERSDNLLKIRRDTEHATVLTRQAVAFSRTANVTLAATSHQEIPGVPVGDYVAVYVADTAIGMDAEIRALSSEPFSTTKDMGKRLDLSTVASVARQSEWHVIVTSTLGQGTTVKVYFPRMTSHDESASQDECRGITKS